MKMVVLISLLVMLSGGCLSYMSAKKSSDELAVKAVRTRDGAGVAVDILNLEALKLHPIRQTLAALGDALVIYATYDYVDGLDKKESKSGSSRDTHVTVSGDGNSINISGDTTTTTTTTTTSTDSSTDNSSGDM